MMRRTSVIPMFYGTLASVILLGVYFAVLSMVSGWGFAQSQFASFWYFIVSLAVGFGIQDIVDDVAGAAEQAENPKRLQCFGQQGRIGEVARKGQGGQDKQVLEPLLGPE